MADRGVPFLVSYAHAQDGSSPAGTPHFSDQMVERFFSDLKENAAQLIALKPGADIGFLDTGMRGGTQWVHELMLAIGTCQVLVALLSVPYLSREWCGKEWHAFSQREVERLPGTNLSRNQGCIIPVIWAPIPFTLPSPAHEDMIFSPSGTPDADLPGEYRLNGLYGLLRMGRMESYKIIVWQLALLISRVYHGQRLKSRKFRPEDLENVFKGVLL